MSRAAALLLLPPSKGKAEGGDGPRYDPARGVLAEARQALCEAVANDLEHLDDRALLRIAGVRAKDVDRARTELAALRSAPTLPAHRRYTGIVHGNAGLADLDPATLGAEVRIVSALAGLVGPAEPLPPYRLEFAASLPSLGGIATFWRDRAADHLAGLVEGRLVWDLLPGEHARIWPRSLRDRTDVARVAFVRPDGRAANAARTKVAKGRLAAFLLEHPQASIEQVVSEADPGVGWKLVADAEGVRATFVG